MGTLDLELHGILIYDMKNGKEKEENIWRRKKRKIFGEGKRRKYLEKGNICYVQEKKNRE